MHPAVIFRLLVLLLLANGTPMVAGKLLGARFARPLDGGLKFADGRPLFGRSKTIRGVVLAILVTIAGAPLVGLAWQIGLLTSALAMAGDLCSSFLKRRLGLPASSPAVGIDQIPESLFPLLACIGPLSLTPADVAVGVAVFFVGELLLSRLLYAFDLRDRPY
jgi:hypothetical protein